MFPANVSVGVTERKIRSVLIAASCIGLLTLSGPDGSSLAVVEAAQGGPAGGQGRSSSPQARVPGPGSWDWWNDANVQKELGLTPEKVAQLDQHYRQRSEQLTPVVKRWQKELATLDQMTRAAEVDESTYTLQVVAVESLRSEIIKSRTVMLYRMFRELSPEQHRRLQDIFARMRSSRDRGRSQ
jgi:Spy/CpxP family protein refolding chaperone